MSIPSLLRATALVALVAGASAAPLVAENWPQWRGPQNNGLSSATGLPAEFGDGKNVLWKVPLPGQAGATPVIWGDRIFLTSVDGDELILLAVSTDGKELWRRKVGQGNQVARGDEGNSASPSPVTDGTHVWTFMGTGELACFDFDGNEVWSTNLQDRYGRFNIQFGMTSTPVLDGDRLYFQLIHGEMRPRPQFDAQGNPLPEPLDAKVLALDKHTGTELWVVDRVSDAKAECKHSYASHMLYDYDGLKFLLTHGADYAIAYDVDTGREIWRCGGLNFDNRYDFTLRFVSSPAVAPGIIVIPSAKNHPVIALRPDLKGDVTNDESAYLWKRDSGTPDVPSPLIHGGQVYLCRENGDLICVDARTGEERYYERTHRERHRASPVYADGKIYLCARDGVISVVKAGPTYELLAQNELGEEITSSPSISNGTMYLRTFENLWAIRGE